MTSYAELSADCKRAVAMREVARHPMESNRSIARRLGISHTLVNAARHAVEDGEPTDFALAAAAEQEAQNW